MGKKQQKSKAIAFTFRPFLADFPFFWAKNSKKKAFNFSSIFQWAKNSKKSKAIAFTFRPFLATFSIFHKWAKTAKK